MGRTTAHILVIAILVALVAVAFMRVNYTWNWDGVWEYRQKFIQGWVTTLVLSVAALVGSIVIGMVAAMMLQSRREFVQALARVYVELVRGTPLLVQLLIGFYVVASAVGLDNRFVVGVLSLSLFSGATWRKYFAVAWLRFRRRSEMLPVRSDSRSGSQCVW